MDDEDPLANFAFGDVSSDEADEAQATKSRRTGQSEEAWRVVQKQYKAKVENGDVSEPRRKQGYLALTWTRFTRRSSSHLAMTPPRWIFKRLSTPLKNTTSFTVIEKLSCSLLRP
jgi:hypothetical protein